MNPVEEWDAIRDALLLGLLENAADAADRLYEHMQRGGNGPPWISREKTRHVCEFLISLWESEKT